MRAALLLLGVAASSLLGAAGCRGPWPGLPWRVQEEEPCSQHVECVHGDIPVCGAEGLCVTTWQARQVADRACAERAAAGIQPGRTRAALSEEQDEYGSCVACREHRDCPASTGPRACWHGTCVAACLRHSDCMNDGFVCDRYARLVPGRDAPPADGETPAMGACVPRNEVAFVRGTDARCAGEVGDREHPFCQLADALDRLSALGHEAKKAGRRARFSVSLLESTLSHHTDTLRLPLDVLDLSLYGPDDPQRPMAVLGRNFGAQDGVEIRAGERVVLDRVLVHEARDGIVCHQGGEVWLRRSALVNHDGVGLRAEGCAVQLDRVRIESNGDGALRLRGAATFAVRNSLIAHNSTRDAPIVELDGPAAVDFVQNTVANNLTGFSLALYCRPGVGSKRISGSLVVGNRADGAQRAQIKGCPLAQVVVDDDSAGGIRGAPEFVDPRQGGSYQLRESGPNRACCIDRAEKAAGDSPLDEDLAGTRRLPGRVDIGAHEAG